jgi:DNA-directed RNA polymerase subunit RPC12/RpoP
MDRPRWCPECGSRSVVEVVYGMPAPDLIELEERGGVILAGCLVGDDDPRHGCVDCGARFTLEADSELNEDPLEG